MQQVQILGVIALSGALGALARYASVLAATHLWGDRFPYGTLLVNVLGCLVMGVAYAALPDPKEPTPAALWLRYGLMVGFLGAYTTFSAFSLENFKLMQQGEAHWALINALASVAFCLAAVWAGVRIGETIL